MEKCEATPESQRRADAARSPVSFLSAEQFNAYRGQLIALLFDGPEKGKVIACAPLDAERPSIPRNSVREQVAASPYKGRRYQLRPILD